MDSRHGGDVALQPALSVPYAFSSEKLPIGVQLVAKWLDEDTLLRLGAMLERRGGLSDAIPIFEGPAPLTRTPGAIGSLTVMS